MKIIFMVIFYFFNILSCYSQEHDIIYIWNSILTELNIPRNYCYDNIESAIHSDRITAEIIMSNNRHDDKYIDFIYFLNFGAYKKTIYRSGDSLIYFLVEVEVYLNEYEKIKELFPYYTMEQFILNENHWTIMEEYSDNQRLAYEVEKDKNNIIWNYLIIFFINNEIDKIKLIFRLE
jgi:hypothetical protein